MMHILPAIPSSKPFWSQYVHFYYFDISDSPANIILELFPFQLMDSAIRRWFPIYLGTLYKMKPVVVPLLCFFIPPGSIIKSNNIG
jgi:hypothetical protein